MSITTTVTGMVIAASPHKDYDKRLLLLTRERGKISAFANGARKPNSALVGASQLFSFGTFELIEGRSSYVVTAASVKEHFEYLSEDVEVMCYASYFAEFADYYSRENTDGGPMLKLLYFAFRALKNPDPPKRLIRHVFELKAMALEGEYFEKPRTAAGESASYAWTYVLMTDPARLFRFTLSDSAMKEFIRAVEDMKEYFIDRPFRSLEILRQLSES